MIIDSHTHLFPPEVATKRQSFLRCDPSFRLLYENEKARMARLEELLTSMNQEGVDRSVICGFPWQDPGLCREGNDYLWDCARLHPDRLLPFACFSLRSPRAAEKELERSLARGFAGIGELALYQRGFSQKTFQFLTSLLRPLSPQRIPVLIHANEPVGHEYPGKGPEGLRYLYSLLEALPQVAFIFAHWGGGLFFYELMPEVARAAVHAYYDTAASPFLYRSAIYEVALRILGSGRILFGSDYPLLPPRRYFRELAEGGLPPGVQAQIKGGNAQNLFGRKSTSGSGAQDQV
jgi:uncharacterized protein